MPLFGNKFSPKKTPQRKASTQTTEEHLDELVSDGRVVRIKLGGQENTFQNGHWTPEEKSHSSNHRLTQKLNSLQEENNLLRLKYEILLNMLTQTTAESHLQQREIDKLRKLQVTNKK